MSLVKMIAVGVVLAANSNAAPTAAVSNRLDEIVSHLQAEPESTTRLTSLAAELTNIATPEIVPVARQMYQIEKKHNKDRLPFYLPPIARSLRVTGGEQAAALGREIVEDLLGEGHHPRVPRPDYDDRYCGSMHLLIELLGEEGSRESLKLLRVVSNSQETDMWSRLMATGEVLRHEARAATDSLAAAVRWLVAKLPKQKFVEDEWRFTSPSAIRNLSVIYALRSLGPNAADAIRAEVRIIRKSVGDESFIIGRLLDAAAALDEEQETGRRPTPL